MIKVILSSVIVFILLFNFNIPAFAAETMTNSQVITINSTANDFLTAKNENIAVDLFSPDEHNLDLLLGVILSVIPGFGAGHFWLGNDADGWTFLKLDLIMLVIPLALTMISTIFSSFSIVKVASGENMQPEINVFSILGLVAWATALGVKIWEVGSVWRFVNEVKKNEKKVTLYRDKVELTVLNF